MKIDRITYGETGEIMEVCYTKKNRPNELTTVEFLPAKTPKEFKKWMKEMK